ATSSGRKLGKEVLEEFMALFGELASKFRPTGPDVATVQEWGSSPNEPMFHKYASLTVAAARDLTKYQSPTFKAIEVSGPAPMVESGEGKMITTFTLKIFDQDLRTKAITRQPQGRRDIG
ncbi:MAG: hypothetical protein ACRETL_00430, partial [Gammaproteobacteria bacterium]